MQQCRFCGQMVSANSLSFIETGDLACPQCHPQLQAQLAARTQARMHRARGTKESRDATILNGIVLLGIVVVVGGLLTGDNGIIFVCVIVGNLLFLLAKLLRFF